MKLGRMIAMMLVACLLYGCALFGNSPKDKFPGGLESMCYGCRNQAKALIDGKHIFSTLSVKGDNTINLVAGEKLVGGIWAWYDPSWKMYVYGLCNGETTWIGCNPVTKGDVNTPTLTHEQAHYWLITNFGINTHDARLDDCFFQWRGSREATGRSTDRLSIMASYGRLSAGGTMGIQYTDAKGIKWAIDVIKAE